MYPRETPAASLVPSLDMAMDCHCLNGAGPTYGVEATHVSSAMNPASSILRNQIKPATEHARGTELRFVARVSATGDGAGSKGFRAQPVV